MQSLNRIVFTSLCLLLLMLGILGGGLKYIDDSSQSAVSAVMATPVPASNGSEQGYNFQIGQPLYDPQGELFGRIVEISQMHHFENGAWESGVLLTFRERQGMEHTPLCWLPMRSAADMVNRHAP